MKNFIVLFISSTFAVLNVPAQPLQSIVACYPLACDNAQNYSGSGSSLDGTPFNVTCAVGHKGLPNTAYNFPGSNSSYIALPASPGVLQAPSACVSGWFNLNSTASSQYMILAKNSCINVGGDWEGYCLAYSAGKFIVFKNGGSTPSNPCAAALQGTMLTSLPSLSVLAGVWYHIVFYVDGTKLWLYVNNQFQGMVNNPGAIDYDLSSSVIVGGPGGPWPVLPYNGRIDNLKFFMAELSTGDVQTLYDDNFDCGGSQRPTGLADLKSSAFPVNVYPNPSSGKFLAENTNGLSLIITDITGRQIAFDQIQMDNKTEISIREHKTGLHILSLYNQDGKLVETKKLSIE